MGVAWGRSRRDANDRQLGHNICYSGDARGPEDGMPNAFEWTSDNRFLRAMPQACAERLEPHAHSAPLERRAVLVEAGANPTNLYFPDRGMISLVKRMSDGRSAEVAVVGVEGLTSVATLLGVERSP